MCFRCVFCDKDGPVHRKVPHGAHITPTKLKTAAPPSWQWPSDTIQVSHVSPGKSLWPPHVWLLFLFLNDVDEDC